MRREVKFLICGLVGGFVFCFVLWVLCLSSFASELEEPEALEVSESTSIVQDIQTEPEEPPRSEPEPLPEVVQDSQEDNQESIPEPRIYDESPRGIQPLAGGVIVGELIDLLQETVIENDGYTAESWQRYENAVSAAWDVIGNFMAYTNEEVRVIIDELQAAVAGLEYPAENPPVIGDISEGSEYMTTGIYAVVGGVAALGFVSKWNVSV